MFACISRDYKVGWLEGNEGEIDDNKETPKKNNERENIVKMCIHAYTQTYITLHPQPASCSFSNLNSQLELYNFFLLFFF
jgi:uncharacterized cysteine cluster protein YcgN (CxxCxxCC family)